MTNSDDRGPAPIQDVDPKPAYQPPKITTYTSEEILEQVGPALACTISDGNPV